MLERNLPHSVCIASFLLHGLPKEYHAVPGIGISSIITQLVLAFCSTDHSMSFPVWLHHTIGCYVTNTDDSPTWEEELYVFNSSKAYCAFLLVWG